MDLILLTKFYPFGTGEAFIENEIEILSKFFTKISIIACEVPKQMMKCRNVPSNVNIYKIESKSKIIDIASSCFSKDINNLTFIKEKEHLNTYKEKSFLKYFEYKSQRIYQEIVKNKFLNELYDSNEIIIYSYWLFSTARVAMLIKNNLNINIKLIVSRAHGYDLYEERNFLKYLPYREIFLNEFDYILPCSENGEKYLNDLYPEHGMKVHRSYLGTKDEGLSRSDKNELFSILTCSRIESVKRLDRLVESLALIENNFNPIKWTHIGMGKDFNKLVKKIKKLLPNIQVEFLGNLSNKEVLEYYKKNSIDVFVNVSASEGLPVSIMEAISFGIPIIATDVGGTSEIVFNNINGYLIPKDFDNETLIEIIKEMMRIKRTEKYISLRKESRRLWETRFQADKNYTDFCHILIKAVKRRKTNDFDLLSRE